ncbi:MAG: DUF2852 domain-containing protein [bacterium]
MSSTNGSTHDQTSHGSREGHCCWGKKGNWSGLNIAAMVLGFVLFWPVGLFILYWIVTGRNVQDLPQGARRQWSKVTGKGSDKHSGSSDNVVFTDFQQTQYDRIREITEEIKERARRFREFRFNAKRRADEEEFNRFMSDTPGRSDS